MRMETERLILRDYVPADLPDYCRLKTDPQTMYYLQDIQLHSPEEGRQGRPPIRAKDFAKRRFHE